MAELAYAEVSKTFVQKTCGFDPRCSHHMIPEYLCTRDILFVHSGILLC